MVLKLKNNFSLSSRLFGHVQGVCELPSGGFAVSRNDGSGDQCDLIVFDSRGNEEKRVTIFADHCGGLDRSEDGVIAFSSTKGSKGSVDFYRFGVCGEGWSYEGCPESLKSDHGVLAVGYAKLGGEDYVAVLNKEVYYAGVDGVSERYTIGLRVYRDRAWRLIRNLSCEIEDVEKAHNNMSLSVWGDELVLTLFRAHGALWRHMRVSSYSYNPKRDEVKKIGEENKIGRSVLFSARWGACLGKAGYWVTGRNFDLDGRLEVKEIDF